MRVLIIANNGGGLYHFRGELLEELQKNHEAHFSLPQDEYVEKFVQMGCVYHPCEFDRHGTNPIKELGQILHYRKLIKQCRPDVVLTYTIKPNVYGGIACRLAGVPYIANITGLGTALENPGLLQKITIPLYRCGLRKAQKVFFQNAENREFMLRNKIVKGNYDLLPGSGVNLTRYQVLDYPSDDTVDFVFIARIMKEKGIEQYLDAAKFIRKKYPNTRFHICGRCEQNYKDVLQNLSDDGTVIYHGVVSDITSVHRVSQCTIHPTYYPEGMSNVLLESCACGRPIITTNRSGCREIVDDSVNGFVVNQRDSQDLIDKIEKFLALSWEERRNMGLAGRKKVEREFDRTIVVGKYLRELEKIHN